MNLSDILEPDSVDQCEAEIAQAWQRLCEVNTTAKAINGQEPTIREACLSIFGLGFTAGLKWSKARLDDLQEEASEVIE